MRLLYRRLPQRGPGAARASGEEAGAARRSREDDHRGARWPSLPLHRLRQISRGGARRDPRGSRTLSRVSAGFGDDHKMRSKGRNEVLAVAATLFVVALAVPAASDDTADKLAAPESFAGISDPAARSAAMFVELGKVLT